MSYSTAECLRRGAWNLRANWELVLLQLLQTLGVTVLTLLGLFPLLIGLGFQGAELLELMRRQDAEALEQSVGDALSLVQGNWGPLLLGVLAAGIVWTLAFILYCYFQAGIYGSLMAGECQAPPRAGAAWQAFRTISWRRFFFWARSYLWRYFWLLNFFVVLFTLWVAVAMIVVALAAAGGQHWGCSAAAGIGCGGALPLLFVGLVIAFWSLLAQADAAREESSLKRALAGTLRLVSKRFGALTLLFLLFLLLSFAVGLVSTLGFALFDYSIDSFSPVSLTLRFFMMLLQWLVGGVLSVGFAAALVTLVRGQTLDEVKA